jgi:hypothetical protein
VAAALTAGAAVAFAPIAPATAQYDGTPSLTCRPTSVAPGAAVDCEANGFRTGSEVTFTLTAPAVTATARAEGADGKAAATLTVPDDTPEGPTKVTATGSAASDGAPLELSADLTITASATTTGSTPDGTTTDGTTTDGTSTFTGPATTPSANSGASTPWVWVLVAIVVVAGGIAFVTMRQRAKNNEDADADGEGADDAAPDRPDDGPEPYLDPDG